MRQLSRREFVIVTGGGVTAAAIAAACGDDDDGGGEAIDPGDQVTPETTPTRAPAADVTAGVDNGAAGLRWYGQSMFLLTSPQGTTILLDPFSDIGYTLPPPVEANAATITHEHPDHSNAALAATGAEILRGLTQEGWADIDQNVGGVRIKTIRTYHDDQQGAARGRNAVFVFEMAGLRLAHLGDLGHQLDAEQTTALGGPVDVLMVPVGGGFTIDAAGATELVAALQPRLVFPMHYKTDRIAFPLATIDGFLEGKTVERAGSTTMRLAADTLPAETTVMVLDFE
jgi:L-ascorbate metabolism protein UlaG (beta-lactamase superfamily)